MVVKRYVCELVDISLNKNSVFGDTSFINPGGIRIGTAETLTTRGFVESDFEKVGDLIDRVICLSQRVQEKSGKKLKDFKEELHINHQNKLEELKDEVNQFAEKFEFIEEFI